MKVSETIWKSLSKISVNHGYAIEKLIHLHKNKLEILFDNSIGIVEFDNQMQAHRHFEVIIEKEEQLKREMEKLNEWNKQKEETILSQHDIIEKLIESNKQKEETHSQQYIIEKLNEYNKQKDEELNIKNTKLNEIFLETNTPKCHGVRDTENRFQLRFGIWVKNNEGIIAGSTIWSYIIVVIYYLFISCSNYLILAICMKKRIYST